MNRASLIGAFEGCYKVGNLAKNTARLGGIFVSYDIVLIGALERHPFELFVQWLEQLHNGITANDYSNKNMLLDID